MLVIGTIKDSGNCIEVLLFSYYTNITGWGVHLMYTLLYHKTAGCFEVLFMVLLCCHGSISSHIPEAHASTTSLPSQLGRLSK